MRISSLAALMGLLIANVVPMVGVLAFGWHVLDLLLLYWLEAAVVGVFTVVWVLLSMGDPNDTGLGVLFGFDRYTGPGAGTSNVQFGAVTLGSLLFALVVLVVLVVLKTAADVLVEYADLLLRAA